MSVFTIDNIRKTFRNGEIEEEVLKGISLDLQAGDMTALVGSSGSGKSTLLTIAAGLQSPTSGEIVFAGENLAKMNMEQNRKIRASEFGFIFQFSHLVPYLTVEEQLLLMLDVAEKKLTKQEKTARIDQILQLIGLTHRKQNYPQSLSGGEKQRVAVARAHHRIGGHRRIHDAGRGLGAGRHRSRRYRVAEHRGHSLPAGPGPQGSQGLQRAEEAGARSAV